jgi:hypothetical protein
MGILAQVVEVRHMQASELVLPELQRASLVLDHEVELPVAEAQREQVALVREVEELFAGSLLLLTREMRKEVVAVQMVLVPPSVHFAALLELLPDVGIATAASRVGAQSRCDMISFETERGSSLPGQRTIWGTRNAPSQPVFFSLRNFVVPASGQELRCRPLSVD